MSLTEQPTRAPRAERSRQAIADALLSLLDEGDLQPTANRIAERAGISLRLIYHHFGDLEALFEAACERETVRVLERVKPVDKRLPFDERLDCFVEQRCRTLEWMTPVCRAAALHAPFSPTLRTAGVHATSAGDHELCRVFAKEIGRLPEELRTSTVDAMCMATTWPAYNDLRRRGADEPRCRAAMRLTVATLLAPGR